MNNGFNVKRPTLTANEVYTMELNEPCYSALVKNFTEGALYVFNGNDKNSFDESKAIKINPKMGQNVFINLIVNSSEESFNKLFFKSVAGGEIEVQLIGF